MAIVDHAELFAETESPAQFIEKIAMAARGEKAYIERSQIDSEFEINQLLYLEWHMMQRQRKGHPLNTDVILGAIKQPMFYIAHHYSSSDSGVEAKRADLVKKFCSKLLHFGFLWFSPICHSHHVSSNLGREHQRDAHIFLKIDLNILKNSCNAMVMLLTENADWYRSQGVSKETELAYAMGIPIYPISIGK